MKKRILLILLLLLMPLTFVSAEKTLLGHVLWDSNNKTLKASPPGKDFNGEACIKRGIASCNVCTSWGGDFLKKPKAVTAITPPLNKVASLYGVPANEIKFEDARAYDCNNGAQYNVMNVYRVTSEPVYYTLTVRACNICCNGSGNVAINNPYPTGTHASITTIEGARPEIHYQAIDDSVVTRITDSAFPGSQNVCSDLTRAYVPTMGAANRTITVHFKKDLPRYQLTVQACSCCGGSGLVAINSLYPTNTYDSTTATEGTPFTIHFQPDHDTGSEVLRISDGEINDAHENLDVGYNITMGKSNRLITVHFGADIVTPKINIYNSSSLPINNQQLHREQIITVKDSSTYQTAQSTTTTAYGETNRNRQWRYWDHNTGKWEILYRYHIYDNLIANNYVAQAEPYANSSAPLTDESFPYYVKKISPSENGYVHDVAFRIIHNKNYDDPIGEVPVDYTGYVYDDTYVIPPNGLGTDFNIIYTDPSSNMVKNVTDKKWTNSADSLSITLKPINLATIEPDKISWTCSDSNVNILKNDDGTATAEIQKRDEKTTFYLYYPGSHTKDHWTCYTNSSSVDFIIMHNTDNVTDIEWESSAENQKVTLHPTDETLSHYTWQYKIPTNPNWLPLSSTTTPSLASIKYNQEYTFRLLANGQEVQHHTLMIPPEGTELITNANVKVGISSPKIIYTDEAPATSNTIQIPNIKITLTPQITSGLTLDDSWTWQVWLTGKEKSNPTQFLLKTNFNATNYTTPVSGEWYESKPFASVNTHILNGEYTYNNIPYNVTELTIPYWVTSKIAGNKLTFTAYARLVCTDGRKTNYSSASSSTRLENRPQTREEDDCKEYITVIDDLTLDRTTPIYEAGSKPQLSLNIAQTDTISILTETPSILERETYTNNLTAPSKFETNIELASIGDYDSGKSYNELTIKGYLNGDIHTATEKIRIIPNWYFIPTPPQPHHPTSHPTYGPLGNSNNSALKILSVRDLRWQAIYNTTNPPHWGLYKSFGNKNLLQDLTINGVNISELKKGYAVEFELTVSDTFAEYLKNSDDANITIKTNLADLGLSLDGVTLTGSSDYATIKLDRKIVNSNKNIFNVSHENFKTWKFFYYLPAKVTGSGNTANIKFTSIIADNGEGSEFNWMDLAELEYGWEGKVFTYNLKRSALEDLGNNAN